MIIDFDNAKFIEEISLAAEAMLVCQVFLLNKPALSRLSSSPLASVFSSISQRLASSRFVNSLANSRSNISAHYDISNEMFMGWSSVLLAKYRV